MMISYLAFSKKEFVEAARTYKLLILGTVFLLIGMMNPLTAKLMPQMLAKFMPEGISIQIGEPTALDSWAQFYKNVPQMGLFVLVIVFSGIMANEYSRGTLVQLLTKGLGRGTVLLAKFTVSVCLWTASYLLCLGVTWAYTEYFWRDASTAGLPFAAFCLWLFGVFLLACILLGGSLFRSGYAGMLFTGGITASLLIVNIAPSIQKYNPVSLSSRNMELLSGTITAGDLTGCVVVCCVCVLAFLAAAVAVFQKKML